MTWMTFLSENAWKATVLLSAACAVGILLRSRSASLRHFVWTATFAALVGLPAAVLMAPKWGLPVRRAPASVSSPARVVAAPSAGGRVLRSGQKVPPEPSRMPAIALFAWLAGCLTVASRFLVGVARTSWMVGHAAPAGYAQPMVADLAKSLGLRRPVRAFETAAAPMPLTWGILRPVVVLPDDARRWPEARLRSVVLHELMHVARFDLLAQAVAQAACCLYWFHPLAWVGWRQLRKERERACDDAVLVRGVAAHDYAGHLLDSVRSMAARRSPWVDAPAMAESSDLESRVRAMLDPKRSRQPLSRRAALAVGLAVAAIWVPLAAIHAQGAVGTLTGSVSDPSDARIPRCRVTARNLDGTNLETTVTDEAGQYVFTGIPAGHYELEFETRGFARGKTQAVLVAGATARVDTHLEIGQVTENVVIRGQKPAGVAAAQQPAASPHAIRVGGMVEPLKLIHQTRPVYPADLQQLGVEGTVIMSAIVSKTGTVLSPRVRNTVDPRLAAAAIDAVKQWVYQPTLLNGEPIEMLTTITLEFQLGQ